MRVLANALDLWVFSRARDRPNYLLLQASRENADRFFGGNRFWQIPGTFLDQDGEPAIDAVRRCASELNLDPLGLWAVEHVSMIFNRRFDALQVIPTFAAEVEGLPEPRLEPFEYDAFEWGDASVVEQRLTYRALLEGFVQVRRYIVDVERPRGEFGIA